MKNELGIARPSRTDKLKYRLWQECRRVCPYSGKSIGVDELFSQAVYEIEHIIPYSRCLDDSFINKTLCHRDWNKKKGNQTPWEAFHGDESESEYAGMLQRAKQLPYAKFKRFAADAVRDLDQFVSQQLNETRYIARKTADYLKQLGIVVEPVKGGTTALLRRAWGLNNILDRSGEKTRLDHRHHAIDALVVAYTNRSAVQKINSYTHHNSYGELRIRDYPPPFADIRRQAEQMVGDIIVSHKPQRKVKGALHKEFLYSLTDMVDAKGTPIVAIRKALADMKAADLKHIRDDRTKELALAHLEKSKNYNDVFKNPANPFGMPTKDGGFRKINKVRLLYNRSVTAIGKVLAGSKDKRRNVWTMGNHHLELVEYQDKKGNRKWRAEVVSTLEATLRNASRGKQPIIKTEFEPGERFLAALHQNDMVKLLHKGQEKLCRVQKMDINQNVIFREHTDADKDWKKEISFTANSLRAADLRLIDVDPIGNIVKEQTI